MQRTEEKQVWDAKLELLSLGCLGDIDGDDLIP
jgi:hypothetical protein